ncbi:efflux RND transporter periplasmic adaptor subunit [Bacteriovoracales bacterium]|nr:efflux RND transporter periplasmic adaptor subunit [Bacteriovoracales bacterium]
MKNFLLLFSIFFLGFFSAVGVNETVGIDKLKSKIFVAKDKAIVYAKELMGKKARQPASDGNTAKTGENEGELEEEGKKKGLPVHTDVLGLRDIKKYFTTYGNLKPWKQVNLKPSRELTVREVRVKVGDYVEVGEVIVEFESELQNEKKKLAAIELKLKNAEFSMTKKLAMKNFISKNEMRQKKLGMEAQALRYKIEQIQSNKQFMKAPISGIISSINLNDGDFINDPSKFTISIVDQEEFKVDLFLPPQVASALQDGVPVEVFRNGLKGEEKVPGSVISIAPTLDLKSGTVKTSLGVSTPPEKWRSGMYVKIKVTVASLEGVLAIKNSALIQEKNKMVAFKVLENPEKGDIAKKVVPLLGASDGRYTEVKSGLEFFDKIVIKGQGSLKDQTIVNVLK